MPTALIWGASGGIGRALVEQHIAQGWTVYGAARQVDNIPDRVAQRFSFDASKLSSFQEVALLLAHEIDALDRVIYAAGGIQYTKVLELGQQNWHNMMNVNLHGAYYSIESTLPLMREGGTFVVLGAYPEKITLPRFGAYASAKAALQPMMEILAKEQRKHIFRLMRLPAVNTPFWNALPIKVPEYALSPSVAAERILNALNHEEQVVIDL
ncbi:MAG: SDR family NAD(P)-dependent oxidoreductase [Phototrophicaceae bacterium]